MFGPEKGTWVNHDWKGWWGPNPPWHAPTFVLTHFPRPSIAMEGGTTYHFITGGIEAVLNEARHAAGQRNVKIAGGVSTVRQYLEADLVDDLQLSISPIILGRGESLLSGLDLKARGFSVSRRSIGAHAMHVVLSRSGENP